MGSYVEKRISNRDRLLMVEEYVNIALMENKIFAASDVAKAIYDDTDYIDYKSLNKYIYADLDALKTAGYDFVTVAGKGYRILSRPDKLSFLDIEIITDCINGSNALAYEEQDRLKFKLSNLGKKVDANLTPLATKINTILGYIGKINKGKHISPKVLRIKYKDGIFVDLRDYPFVNELSQETYEHLIGPYQMTKYFILRGFHIDGNCWIDIDIRNIVSFEYAGDLKDYSDMDIDELYRLNHPTNEERLSRYAEKNTYTVLLRIPKYEIKSLVNYMGRPERKHYSIKKYIIKDDPQDAYFCLVKMEFCFPFHLDRIIRWSLLCPECELLGSDFAIEEKKRILEEELSKLEKPV